MKKTLSLCIAIAFLSLWRISAQELDIHAMPKNAYIDEAKSIANTFFTNFKEKKLKENADFIVNSLGAAWDETKKISQRNEYLGKFEIISLKPPKGLYGDLDDYDLIEEGFLPGSDRYFRHTYIGYHEGSVLIYEFRFYVNHNEEVTLHYIGWSEKNPFEYMSTADMLLPKY